MQVNGKSWPFDRVFCAELTITRNVNDAVMLTAKMVYHNADGTTYGSCLFEHNDARAILTLHPDSEKAIKNCMQELEKNFLKVVLGTDPKSDVKAESNEGLKAPLVGIGGTS